MYDGCPVEIVPVQRVDVQVVRPVCARRRADRRRGRVRTGHKTRVTQPGRRVVTAKCVSLLFIILIAKRRKGDVNFSRAQGKGRKRAVSIGKIGGVYGFVREKYGTVCLKTR